VSIVRSDYRDFSRPGAFDKATSVGMAEHVGVKNLPGFPNGELQTILQVQDGAARAGFEIRDVEYLREHHVLALENWFGSWRPAETRR
jgi:cyclopropane-fatty-acyl-phospholipid synthase